MRKIATRFDVSKAFGQRLLKQKRTKGHVQPEKQGGSLKSELHGYSTHLASMVEHYPDATLSEYCQYWGETHNQWVSTSTMCRELNRQQLTLKKSRYARSSAVLTGEVSPVKLACQCAKPASAKAEM